MEFSNFPGLETACVWYALMTLVGVVFAVAYNWWIERQGEETNGELIYTSFLVAVGVFIVELIRVIRALPFAEVLPTWIDDPVAFVGIFGIDSICAYVPMGLPMILGNLNRVKKRRLLERERARAQTLAAREELDG